VVIFRIAIAAALFSSPAFAGDCYVSKEDPTWAIEVLQGGFKWNQGVTSVDLDETGAGTGVSRRVAITQDGKEAYPYLFHKGDLIFDNEVYVPAQADKCK
jgi:hypothetical protein